MGIQSLIFISSDVFTKHNFQTQISIKSDSHTCTGYSLSEALIFASINPKYDNRNCLLNYNLSTCTELVAFRTKFVIQ